jgi:hypothetical protein
MYVVLLVATGPRPPHTVDSTTIEDARGTGLVALGAGDNIERSTILDLDASGLSVTDGGVIAPFT